MGNTVQLYLGVNLCLLLLLYDSPENKKKAITQMRKRTSTGDEIVTIGGMVGKICHVDGELITFETGEDRVRIQIQKWGISTKVGFDPKAKK